MSATTAHQPSALRDYALVADGYRGALIGPRGDVAWMCFPVWHDPALFASLVGGAGTFTVQPVEPFVWGGYYEPGSLIWRSRWVTGSHILESRDALALPADRERAVLLRRLTAIEESAEFAVRLEPAGDYGRATAGRWSGSGDVRTWESADGPVRYRLRGASHARVGPQGLGMTIRLEQGESRDLVLEITAGNDTADDIDAGQAWEQTAAEWQLATPDCPDPAVRRDVHHAFAVIRGLTAPSGGTVAAATTALPERADANRAYDYRYVWIRDTCYIGCAAAAAGAADYVARATRFVVDRLIADGDRMAPAYTIDGGPVPSPSHLGLPGYPGGADFIGNHVGDQFQLDIFGEALHLLAEADALDLLDPGGWKAATIAFDAIEARWDEPDAGVWELDPRKWTHSRLACIGGLRAAAARPPAAPHAARWLALADRITAAVAASATHPEGRWQRAPDDDRVDASLLLGGIRGAVPPDDPRHIATYDAVVSELCEDGYVYRFRHEAGIPLHDAEGAFVLCSFWMTLAALGRGDEVAAARWFERGRAACGTPGLLSEEFDVNERQLRGNIPQAFVHALLIEAAYSLIRRGDA